MKKRVFHMLGNRQMTFTCEYLYTQPRPNILTHKGRHGQQQQQQQQQQQHQ